MNANNPALILAFGIRRAATLGRLSAVLAVAPFSKSANFRLNRIDAISSSVLQVLNARIAFCCLKRREHVRKWFRPMTDHNRELWYSTQRSLTSKPAARKLVTTLAPDRSQSHKHDRSEDAHPAGLVPDVLDSSALGGHSFGLSWKFAVCRYRSKEKNWLTFVDEYIADLPLVCFYRW
jgi:hypothetical protein